MESDGSMDPISASAVSFEDSIHSLKISFLLSKNWHEDKRKRRNTAIMLHNFQITEWVLMDFDMDYVSLRRNRFFYLIVFNTPASLSKNTKYPYFHGGKSIQTVLIHIFYNGFIDKTP